MQGEATEKMRSDEATDDDDFEAVPARSTKDDNDEG